MDMGESESQLPSPGGGSAPSSCGDSGEYAPPASERPKSPTHKPKRRHGIGLSPGDEAMVCQYARLNSVSFSEAARDMIRHQGKLIGASANLTRLRLRKMEALAEAAVGKYTRREPVSIDLLREIRDLASAALVALG
jgi:hypothetical protein